MKFHSSTSVFALACLALLITACTSGQETAQSDEVELLTEESIDVDASSDSSAPVASEITDVDLKQEGSRSVPFGNGKGLGLVEEAILSLYTDDGAVYAGRFSAGVFENSVKIAPSGPGFSSAASLSTLGNNALALVTGPLGIQGSWSDDGGYTWSGLESLAPQSDGAQVPTSCLWEEGDDLLAMIAWVDPIQVEQGGPLYVRTFNGESWEETMQVGSQDFASSPSLVCNSEVRTMAYREGEGNAIDIWFATETDGSFDDAKEIFDGADVHMAICNETIYLGYHHQGAMLGISKDNGETWSNVQLDTTGKFGSIACSEDTVVVSWGHFPSLKIANDAKSNDNQRSAYAQVSFDGGETWNDWHPAGDSVDQNVSTVAAEPGVAYMLWETTGGIRFASYSE